MRRLICCGLFATLCGAAYGDEASIKVIKDYEGMLRLAAFSCKLKQNNYEAAMQMSSAQQGATRTELMACISDYSGKARSELPKAIDAAKSESLKNAVKGFYTGWNGYFGNFDRASEARFDQARSALETELLIAK